MLQLGASYLSLQAPVTPLYYSRKIWCAHGAQGEDEQLGLGDAEDHHLPRIVSAHNTMKFHPLHLVLIIPLLTDTPRKMFTVGAGVTLEDWDMVTQLICSCRRGLRLSKLPAVIVIALL
ncbi:unnamed protein product [Sphagnum troendelagicum]|uniref:Uncharacterized protein n=1 Tax=Sphagnum troendelagicum TaxID=128251 RepID=A0ABP0TXJ3_9BRYO